MDDLVDKLRDTPCNREAFTPSHAQCQCRTANRAADEIERLRGELDKIRARDARAASKALRGHL